MRGKRERQEVSWLLHLRPYCSPENLWNDYGMPGQCGGYFAKELNELIVARRKPENVTQANWDDIRQEIIDAAATEKP